MRKNLNGISLAIFVLLLPMSLCAQECTELHDASEEQLVSYLNGLDTHGGDFRCVVFAINSLGASRYKPAVPALTKLLTLRQVPSKVEQYFPSKNRPEYPAIPALVRMGEAALPSLAALLKRDDASSVARYNAVLVWMVIYSKQHQLVKGVEELKHQADLTEDLKARQNLLLAASSAAKFCVQRDREACDAAAKETH